jgi:hypothetical protein
MVRNNATDKEFLSVALFLTIGNFYVLNGWNDINI